MLCWCTDLYKGNMTPQGRAEQYEPIALLSTFNEVICAGSFFFVLFVLQQFAQTIRSETLVPMQ